MYLAGLPATTVPLATGLVTTDPAPITQLFPISTPGNIMYLYQYRRYCLSLYPW
jgi:hypothetical protein